MANSCIVYVNNIMAMFSKTSRSYLAEWYQQNRDAFYKEYGGERAGVPKGEAIPFPTHKVDAAIALLSYGAPRFQTLLEVARSASASGALLRVWRTEARFLELYRQAVWKCADDYVRLLSESWVESRLAPYDEFRNCFGIALQEAILHRLCVDVLRMESEWTHFGLTPKAIAECRLVDPPPAVAPDFMQQEKPLIYWNLLLLLAICLVERQVKDPSLARWITNELMDKWRRIRNIDTDLRAAVEKHEYKEAIGHIDFVTQGPSPLDDVKSLYRLFQKKRGSQEK
jgi:cytochrome c556